MGGAVSVTRKENTAPYRLEGMDVADGWGDGWRTIYREERQRQIADTWRKDKIREKPPGPRREGIGFYWGNQQEACNSNFIAIMRATHCLVLRYYSGMNFTALTDWLVASGRPSPHGGNAATRRAGEIAESQEWAAHRSS